MLIARTGKGIRSASRSSTAAGGRAVARRPTDLSQRLTTSRAVNCFQTWLGNGRMSRVSSSTRSPGRTTAQSAGLRIAYGRGQRRWRTLIRRRTAGSCSSPSASGPGSARSSIPTGRCRPGAAAPAACPCPSAGTGAGPHGRLSSCSIVQVARRRRRGAEGRSSRVSRRSSVVAGEPAIDGRPAVARNARGQVDVPAVGPGASRPSSSRRRASRDRSGAAGAGLPRRGDPDLAEGPTSAAGRRLREDFGIESPRADV